jgi:hypothetical protein
MVISAAVELNSQVVVYTLPLKFEVNQSTLQVKH